jgi:hypothetical protein
MVATTTTFLALAPIRGTEEGQDGQAQCSHDGSVRRLTLTAEFAGVETCLYLLLSHYQLLSAPPASKQDLALLRPPRCTIPVAE